MIAHTESGSIYEFDETGNKVRRLHGSNTPTPRQGADGEWREYFKVIPVGCLNPADVVVGCALIIMWDDAGKSTMTSRIVKVEESLARCLIASLVCNKSVVRCKYLM